MDLRSGESLWIERNRDLDFATHALQRDISCEVAIIGGGITGALLADMLAAEKVDTVVLDKRRFGTGSTAASTALLMYELDNDLLDLIERYGRERAERCYRASLQSVHRLAEIIASLNTGCGFEWRKSLQFASKRGHAKRMMEECEARRAMGIDVELLDRETIESMFPFTAPAALHSQIAAQTDPVRITHALMRRAVGRGVRAFSETKVIQIQHAGGPTHVTLTCASGATVRARQVVIAAGYECDEFLPANHQHVGALHSTYAVCSKPTSLDRWHERCFIWESGHPYVYLRTTEDNRAIIGGADVPFQNAAARDALLARKTRILAKRFSKLFPDIPFEIDYAWTGTFGETDDGLPCIGSVPERPGCMFAMGYGGNGMTFGVIAAKIILDICLGRTHPDAELFAFDRLGNGKV